jgi:hypothetical protein
LRKFAERRRLSIDLPQPGSKKAEPRDRGKELHATVEAKALPVLDIWTVALRSKMAVQMIR